MNCSIPVTWYNVKTGVNDTILFNEGAGNLTATLTQGNYSISDLVTEIKTALDTAGLDTYTVTYSSISMKITISSTGSFSLLFNTGSSEIYKLIGFENIDTSSASSHVGSNVIDLALVKRIQIIIPELGVIGRSTDTNVEYTFLIDVDENRGNLVHFNDQGNFNQFQFGSYKTLSQLHVILRDQDNNILDLNGGDWKKTDIEYYII